MAKHSVTTKHPRQAKLDRGTLKSRRMTVTVLVASCIVGRDVPLVAFFAVL
jgi:hypothetical protein